LPLLSPTDLKVIKARTWVRIKGSNRKISWVLVDILVVSLPFLAFAQLYTYVSGGGGFLPLLVIGIAMLPFWLNVVWDMGAQFYWEKQVGNMEIYMLSPASKMAILFGMALGGMFSTSLRSGIIILLAIAVYKMSIPLQLLPPILLIFLLTLTSLYTLGMLFASLFLLYGREAWQTALLVQEPINFISGIYFPIRALPFWIQAVASLIPLTLGIDAMRWLMMGSAFGSLYLHIILLLALTLVFGFLSRKALDFMERLGKKEGRLTLRWQ
jgi:ABC-2 type transport system permease protein